MEYLTHGMHATNSMGTLCVMQRISQGVKGQGSRSARAGSKRRGLEWRLGTDGVCLIAHLPQKWASTDLENVSYSNQRG